MASSAIDAEPIYEEGNEIPGETEAVSNTPEEVIDEAVLFVGKIEALIAGQRSKIDKIDQRSKIV